MSDEKLYCIHCGKSTHVYARCPHRDPKQSRVSVPTLTELFQELTAQMADLSEHCLTWRPHLMQGSARDLVQLRRQCLKLAHAATSLALDLGGPIVSTMAREGVDPEPSDLE